MQTHISAHSRYVIFEISSNNGNKKNQIFFHLSQDGHTDILNDNHLLNMVFQFTNGMDYQVPGGNICNWANGMNPCKKGIN